MTEPCAPSCRLSTHASHWLVVIPREEPYLEARFPSKYSGLQGFGPSMVLGPACPRPSIAATTAHRSTPGPFLTSRGAEERRGTHASIMPRPTITAIAAIRLAACWSAPSGGVGCGGSCHEQLNRDTPVYCRGGEVPLHSLGAAPDVERHLHPNPRRGRERLVLAFGCTEARAARPRCCPRRTPRGRRYGWPARVRGRGYPRDWQSRATTCRACCAISGPL